VADNASTDNSVEFLKENFPSVRIVQNQENGGFAKGYNDALSKIDADYYVLLNSDIEVTENWIKPVIDLMQSDENIAACQPKLLSYKRQNKFEYAGAAGGYLDKYGYPFCRGRLFKTTEEDHGQYDKESEIFWASGACLFVRARLYHDFGGLDNDFFAHMEEIDFCWRLKNHGYKIMYCPDSTVYHVGGGTLPKKSFKKTYLNMRNNNIMLLKNVPSNRVLKVFIARWVLDGIAAIKFLFDGGIYDFFAVVRAHLSFYRRIPKIRKLRKKTIHNQVSHIYWNNIVFDYYIGGKKKFSDLDPDKFT